VWEAALDVGFGEASPTELPHAISILHRTDATALVVPGASASRRGHGIALA
jgi:hypothetical protein